MKKEIVYILSLAALIFSLCACGAANNPSATNAPPATGTPTAMPTPDMNDGIVNDEDGIITDDDTGVVPTQTPMPDSSAKPSSSAKATDDAAKQGKKHPAGRIGGVFFCARKSVSRVLSAQPSI